MKDGEKSLNKIFDILEILSVSPDGISSKKLIEATGMPRSTVFRMLRFLTERGYAAPSGNAHTLGAAALRLGASASRQNVVARMARPFLLSLSAETRETAHLAELKGGSIVYIDKVEGSRPIRMASMTGLSAPLHCTGIGKAILAFLPEKELSAIIEKMTFTKFTENTLDSAASLKDELEKIKRRGFAVDNSEHEPGVFCVAAPVLDRKLEPLAAVSVSGAVVYMRNRLQELAAGVRDAAGKISRAVEDDLRRGGI
jgi:DNA-binding IclR family transcriptional regulator